MAEIPAFEAFYRATHQGRQPFPWQSRLAQQVADQGWPGEIGIPTGLGKTACLDIAVWALARQAERPPAQRTAPTRVWYVVNRRLLVDAAHQHGESLRRWLREPERLREEWPTAKADDIRAVETVAEALRGVAALKSESSPPLHITRLRGGADLGARVSDPSQPALVFATVPMFASRWLFRGYGSSASMQPVDAALAGIDSLILMDEAHLARPLARLAEPLEQCDVGDPTCLLPRERARPRLVALTATGDSHGDRFQLEADDLAHPEVRKRLHAPKPVDLLPSKRKSLAADLASAALRVLDAAPRPESCLVFVNTPDMAHAVWEALEARKWGGLDIDPYRLTGRVREREAGRIRASLLDVGTGAPSGRDPDLPRTEHLLVVATQTLEVGADVDFDHLVTETAGVRSMVQRLGRLNRLGDKPGATATVVHPSDVQTWPVYGEEPATVWSTLEAEAEAAGAKKLSLSPDRIGEILGEPGDEPPAVAQLLPHHLWDWVKTSGGRRPESPPELFFDRLDDDSATASVVWRLYLPNGLGEDQGAVSNLVPSLRRDEAMDMPLSKLRRTLGQRQSRRQPKDTDDTPTVSRVRSDGQTVEVVDIESLGPGDRVILPADAGLYDEFGWNPDHRGTVPDLSLLRAGLVLNEEVIKGLFSWEADEEELEQRAPGDGLELAVAEGNGSLMLALKGLEPPKKDRDDDGDDYGEDGLDEQRQAHLGVVRDWLEKANPPLWLNVGNDETDDEQKLWRNWRRDLLEGLTATITGEGEGNFVLLDGGTPFLRLLEPAGSRMRRSSASVQSDAFDDLSFVDPTDPTQAKVDVTSPKLDDHLKAVGDGAAAVAQRVGLPDELVEILREAGVAHDLGKREARFQYWLDPDDLSDTPLAKSRTPWYRRERERCRSGWPKGGRHELISAWLLQDGLDQDDPTRDLLLHLVISHHGHGRPLVPVADDPAPTIVHASFRDQPVRTRGDLSRADWEQPARFRQLCETYGYWGLALLEAIVRQTDHAASSFSEVA